jgi:hypothetical protein
MNIFESLENLQVSEECFDEIIEIVEEILSEDIIRAIDKKYDPKIEKAKGNKKKSEILSKKNTLVNKALGNQEKELWTHHNYEKYKDAKMPLDIELKRKSSKNKDGEHKTDLRRFEQARSKFKKLGMFDKGYDQAKDRFQRASDIEREHNRQ